MKTQLHRLVLPALLTLPVVAFGQPAAGNGRQGPPPPPPPPEVLVAELFKTYDTNADGKLSASELAAGLEAVMPPPPGPPPGMQPPPDAPRGPAGAAAEMVRLGDANQDQQLDREELATALELFHEAHPRRGRPCRPEPGSESPSEQH